MLKAIKTLNYKLLPKILFQKFNKKSTENRFSTQNFLAKKFHSKKACLVLFSDLGRRYFGKI